MIISPSAISPYKIPTFQSGGAPFVGLLDLYPSAAGAYSVRRLSGVYSGSLMEVRRSSDNALQDIAFDANGDLDTASLLSFVGAGNGFVRTWYDQSGNAINFQQTTVSEQPQIVSSGSVLLENGKPLISRVNGSTGLESTLSGNVNRWEFGVVSTPSGVLSTLYSEIPNDYMCIAQNGSSSTFVNGVTLNNLYSNGVAITKSRDSFYDNFLTSSILTLDANDSGISNISFGYIPAGSIGMLNMQEIIFYNSNQSGNKTGIETNLSTYYEITLP